MAHKTVGVTVTASPALLASPRGDWRCDEPYTSASFSIPCRSNVIFFVGVAWYMRLVFV